MNDRKKSADDNRRHSISVRALCLAALFAALSCIGTFISVPLPIGYFNLGDIFVLSGAFLLGAPFGAVAAGVGSALADIFMGFVIYAPATFVIKALVAACAALLFAFFFALVDFFVDFFLVKTHDYCNNSSNDNNSGNNIHKSVAVYPPPSREVSLTIVTV